MAIHGWSCVQADPTLRAATLATYQDMRDQVAAVVKKWQATGSMPWPAVPTDRARVGPKRHHAAHSRPRPRREGSGITRPLQSGAPKFYNAQSHSI